MDLYNDTFACSGKLLNRVLGVIREKSPRHSRKISSFLNSVDDQYKDRSELFLIQYEKLLRMHDHDIEYGIDCYLSMCDQMLAEQVFFMRSGKYRYDNFDDVDRLVYSNPEIMQPLLYGLLLSQFLWKSHYEVFEFFIHTLNPLIHSIDSYLEIGPGHGLYISEAIKLLKDTSQVIALDVSESSLQMSKFLVNNERPEFICHDFMTYDFDSKFDFIAMGEVLEHVENPMLLLKRLRYCLADNGHAFITAPANAPSIDHIYLFNDPDHIKSCLRSAGFDIVTEYVCSTENIDLSVAIEKKYPIMYAALVAKS